ncbi:MULTISPECIES: hypothetical protein [unclassified Microbacterium]|uniref:hypothetical protein n=1 Tax=unclassified Microbacterium TaxID=2609290 RepID=UPI0012F78CA0|nr:hypothetical protein [Microbacterium sp. MAH-37]MVQ41684.1 hypothetical protein [Microbacterium sp. MAH-37]
MSSLRAELMGKTGTVIPPYRMLLPPGWEAFDLSEATERDLMRRAEARLHGAQNSAFGPILADKVHEVLEGLRARHGFAYAFAGDAAPTWAIGAATLVGLKRTSSPEATLEQIVESAVRHHGGVPIGEGQQIVRWTERREVSVDGEDVASLLVNYLIPIPGTRLTEAVQWTATVTHEVDLPADHPNLTLWTALFDTHISTFTWTVR